MKRIWVLLFVSIFINGLTAQDANETFVQANDAYVKKSYDQAIQLYESIYAQELKSPELFLNLGNSYYQKGEYAKAILSYERGLKLSPNDSSILENLEIASDQLDSEIVEVPPFILVRWWRALSNIFSTSIWGILQIVLMALLAFFVGRYFLINNQSLKGKNLKFAMTVLPFLILSFLTGATKANLEKDETAVIMIETALSDGPDERSGEINKLYPGNTVLLLDQIGGWYKVRLANQSVGWISENSMEKI